jgi:hypothetical protein
MLRRFLALFLLLTGTTLAGELVLKAPTYVKVLRPYQFQAIFYHDDGTTTNVTHLARFASTDRSRQYGNGNIEFDLPYNLTTDYFTVNVTAEVAYNGQIYMDRKMVRVDASPDNLSIQGPFRLRAGQYTSFRAYAVYAGRRVDVSNSVRWSASQGFFSGYGNYRAPTLTGPYPTNVRITAFFGSRSDSYSVTIDP